MFDVKKIRENFPIFENYRKRCGRELAYLDSAATSQTPKQVVEVMNDYYFNHRASVHRARYALGVEATDSYERARITVAKFIGAKPQETLFTPGATMSANMLVFMLEKSLKLSRGDEILATTADHHSNFVPFQEWAGRTQANFRIIPLGSIDLDYEAVTKLICPQTKIVTLPLASNVLGTIYDVKRVIKLAKEFGAITIVDATTAVGHTEVDARSLECDFLFFSGHKMLGPTGIGVLFGREELLMDLSPGFSGGGVIVRVTEKETVYRDIPRCFEPGTPNVAGALGLACAADYISFVGADLIARHVQLLVAYALDRLSRITGVRIVSEKNEKRNIGIVSFTVEGVRSQRVALLLGREDVAVRAGHHCAMPLMNSLGTDGVCRASFYLYNTKDDVDRLVAGVEKASRLLTQKA